MSNQDAMAKKTDGHKLTIVENTKAIGMHEQRLKQMSMDNDRVRLKGDQLKVTM